MAIENKHSEHDQYIMARATAAADAPYDQDTCRRYPWAAAARIKYLDGIVAAMRPAPTAFLIRILNRLAHPIFDCEDCISMREHGCYCSAVGCSAPCAPPTRVQRAALWLLERMGGKP